ncbi:hypothetical protein [Pararhodobacter sp. SW119]|uniref:hypothetical protein n=1 Tax=Pararhodobacter sp. SW119 TaxID=2780075 RepID=UPI001ADF707A|nr:hypothetical protein [Pararhodobacter sp. SW119]
MTAPEALSTPERRRAACGRERATRRFGRQPLSVGLRQDHRYASPSLRSATSDGSIARAFFAPGAADVVQQVGNHVVAELPGDGRQGQPVPPTAGRPGARAFEQDLENGGGGVPAGNNSRRIRFFIIERPAQSPSVERAAGNLEAKTLGDVFRGWPGRNRFAERKMLKPRAKMNSGIQWREMALAFEHLREEGETLVERLQKLLHGTTRCAA